MIEALKQRQHEIKQLESIAVQKGIDLQVIKEQARTTIYDYKSLLLSAIEQSGIVVSNGITSTE
jgi:hypothetical protein